MRREALQQHPSDMMKNENIGRRHAIVSTIFGLLATGALTLAVSTDYWLYTTEPLPMPEAPIDPETNETIHIRPEDTPIAKFHAGLWRTCPIFEDYELEVMDATCTVINYFHQEWGKSRREGGDTTNSIYRGIRKSSPIIVVSLLFLLAAFAVSTVGNHKRDNRTLVGSVLYITAALLLACGVIVYIAAVNDEVAHRKPPENADMPKFSYRYGWAFFFAGSSFLSAMLAAVTNISLYMKRYNSLEGLRKKGDSFVGKPEPGPEDHFDMGRQNPTIII